VSPAWSFIKSTHFVISSRVWLWQLIHLRSPFTKTIIAISC
jgi:hypothetical protein